MINTLDAIFELGQLLHDTGAKPRLIRERIAPSTLYDFDYHSAIVVCSFSIHAPRDAAGSREILRPWLKLLQFVAARPRLVPDVQQWASSRKLSDLESWSKMPRGYVGDKTHDAVVDLLVAAGIFVVERETVRAGTSVRELDATFDKIVALDLFAFERHIISDLTKLRVSKAMLAGD